MLGPFHMGQIVSDLVSDLGGLSGIGLFLLLIAIIGLAVTWKKRKFYVVYFLLPLLIPAYLYRTNTIFPLAIVIAVFAALGFIKIFERHWVLDSLKKFTFLLLILGIIFSSLTYLDRITINGPTSADEETLTWIKKNTPNDAIILSDPKNSYYINYFAERKAFSGPSKVNNVNNISAQIFSALYIQDLFPLLEENDISYIYLTSDMKQKLPADQGILFLFKNEKFKLVHSYQGYEVWKFTKENDNKIT